ncbi:MAG: circadian clock KaiB family protein [Phenylobacterium sp.]|nr:circadian clock KaiB family protein [Phenylobacterium sp.]
MTTAPETPAVAEPDATSKHVLRLYVTGSTPRSTRAIDNLRRVLESELPDSYDLEVIDVYEHPEAAAEHQILAAPTLIKVLPEPVRRIIGDLSDTERVLRGLDLTARDGRADGGK